MGEGVPRAARALLCALCLSLVVCPGGASTTNGYRDTVLPSEEELRLALDVGEITYEQYLLLMDAVVHGLDSTNILQLQDIPNLEDFLSIDSLQAGTPRAASKAAASASLRHRYYLQYDEPCCAWYRSCVDVSVSNAAECKVDLSREKSGRERVTGRSMQFTPESSWVKAVTLGTFPEKYGLGAVIGYRGKLLDGADRLDAESWRYPDYGGYNGVQVVLGGNGVEGEVMVSQQRDEEHRLGVVAARWGTTKKRWRYGTVMSAARLTNRSTERDVTLPMYSFFAEHRLRNGQLAGELGVQHGQDYQAPVAVAEGSIRFKLVKIQFAGWAYGDKLTELTSGSRAASMSRRADITEADFTYSARRPGQEGMHLRTRVGLSERWELANSILYAGYNRRFRNTDFESELERRFSSRVALAVAVQAQRRERISDADTDRLRLRVESRLQTGIVHARAYIAVTSETEKDRYWSVFGRSRFRLGPENVLECQVNLARFSNNRLEDAYGFIGGRQSLPLGLTGGMKVAQRYSRNGSDHYQTVITLEVSAQL